MMLSMGLNVMWLAKCRYKPDTPVVPHKHDFFHYLFVVSGTGHTEIGGKRYILYENNMYLTPANVQHSYCADKKSGMQVIEIKFSLSDKEMLEKINELPIQIEDSRLFIRQILEIIVEKGIRQESYYSDIINLKYAEVLFYLLENYLPGSNEIDKKGYNRENLNDKHENSDFKPVILYMERHMHNQVELENLAEIVNLNPAYFCKLFSCKYGIPPIQYLNNMRISKAKELLKYSDMNITQISNEVGFQSIHYFSRCFSKKERMSPYEYRQKLKENIYISINEE